MFLCWVKSSRALSFTRLLVSVEKRKKRAEKKRAGSVIGKEQREERRREPVNIFSNASMRPLAEKPFLVSKRQKVRWCSRV